jgi:hypothetical protein
VIYNIKQRAHSPCEDTLVMSNETFVFKMFIQEHGFCGHYATKCYRVQLCQSSKGA